MHTKPMSETEGEFDPPSPKLYDCSYCGGKNCVQITVWNSSCGGYEDEKAECQKCGKVRWYEGADA
jgi:hypothetical protein